MVEKKKQNIEEEVKEAPVQKEKKVAKKTTAKKETKTKEVVAEEKTETVPEVVDPGSGGSGRTGRGCATSGVKL